MPLLLRRCYVLLVLLAAGCSSSQSVGGSVTYDGQPVEDGFLTLVPADGNGTTVGAPINNGKYQIVGVRAGKYKANIIGNRMVETAKTGADPSRVKADKVPVADLIPADAPGNNITVDVSPGNQSLDFSVQKPAKK